MIGLVVGMLGAWHIPHSMLSHITCQPGMQKGSLVLILSLLWQRLNLTHLVPSSELMEATPVRMKSQFLCNCNKVACSSSSLAKRFSLKWVLLYQENFSSQSGEVCVSVLHTYIIICCFCYLQVYEHSNFSALPVLDLFCATWSRKWCDIPVPGISYVVGKEWRREWSTWCGREQVRHRMSWSFHASPITGILPLD